MTRATLPGTPPIELVLRPLARARRVSLRVSGLDGRVTVSFPSGYPEPRAIGFAREKEAWIRRQLESRPEEQPVACGTELPLEGRLVRVEAGTGRSVRLADGAIVAPRDRVGARVGAFLKVMARERLAATSDRYAARLGRGYGRITLRDTRSRWGSCTAAGDLMYSWRLIMAPPEVLDYVAAHEVAHLAHMHHGPAFWEAVGQLFGDYRAERAWLRKQGPGLHRYRFGD